MNQVSFPMVIFYAFGTQLEIKRGQHPYRQLMQVGTSQGRRPQLDDSRQIMCNPWGLRETASAFGIEVQEADTCLRLSFPAPGEQDFVFSASWQYFLVLWFISCTNDSLTRWKINTLRPFGDLYGVT
jgi:hypothetical protein